MASSKNSKNKPGAKTKKGQTALAEAQRATRQQPVTDTNLSAISPATSGTAKTAAVEAAPVLHVPVPQGVPTPMPVFTQATRHQPQVVVTPPQPPAPQRQVVSVPVQQTQEAGKPAEDGPKQWLTAALKAYDAEDFETAYQYCERLVKSNLEDVTSMSNLAVIAQKLDRPAVALVIFERLLAIRPESADLWNNLCLALLRLGRHPEAFKACQKSLELAPGNHTALMNLGLIHRDWNHTEEALAAFEHFHAIRPEDIKIPFDLALAHLKKGDYLKGWPLYETRFESYPEVKKHLSKPQWQGELLDGKTLVLTLEQGFGDNIQCARFVPWLRQFNPGKIILSSPPEMYRLLKTLDGVDEVIRDGEPLPPYDYHTSIMSLPYHLNVILDQLPGSTNYLHHPGPPVARLPQPRPDRLKVGVSWSSKAQNKGSANRNTSLMTFAPLLRSPNVRLYSFQKGAPAEELKQLGLGALVYDLSRHCNDFYDSAGLIQQLDLIITVDTALAHLGGALGKPTWVLLPYSTDWRWLTERTDSPWYPSLRLFRQQNPFDWDGQMAAVVEALKAEYPSFVWGQEASALLGA